MPTIVIRESAARLFWPGGGAVGARMRLGPDLVEVVGIVGDVRNDPARPDAEPMGYRPTRQAPRRLSASSSAPRATRSSAPRPFAP